jgi:hypothetical protein
MRCGIEKGSSITLVERVRKVKKDGEQMQKEPSMQGSAFSVSFRVDEGQLALATRLKLKR